jgi:hypothetical protein
MPDDDTVWEWLDLVRDRIALAAAARNLVPRDFAATLVAAFIAGDHILLLHVGDGAAVMRGAQGWMAPSWPAAGEYASMTNFVTDDPVAELRTTRLDEAIDAIAVFTDGIERLALNFVERQPHAPFFEGVIRPLQSGFHVGRNGALCAALKAYLDGERINARTDDDKTLVLALRR